MRNSLISVIAILICVFSIFTTNPDSARASGNTCLYVLGTVEGKTVTTPAVLVTVPENGVAVNPVQVHVDPANHKILGYSLSTSGLDENTEPQSIYVPGNSKEIPSYSVTLEDLNIENKTCVSFGVTTPAIPIYIPESTLQIPGIIADVPSVTLNILGEKRVVNGQVFSIEGKTIVVPGVTEVVPSQTVETPDQSVTVNINGQLTSAHYLTPQ
ncbi:hypothetical protein [Metabacillus sp. Hm71]|uniref:hypothetical protein n=1 Tax=Metabacillus sp. Hm71 TaxID=3450743 RepID=UPI003F42E019